MSIEPTVPSKPLENGARGKAAWRSLEEYADTPEFHNWLEREFPQGASEFWGGDVSRRNFMRIMGASMALAGLGMASCRRPEAHLVPYTKAPEWQVPGKHLSYATAMPRPGGATPLFGTSFNGRPIKVEGSPLHSTSLGATDSYAQASVLDLYDPERSQVALKNGKAIKGKDFAKKFGKLIEDFKASSGAGLAILADGTASPTRDRLQKELATALPSLKWSEYEPLCSAAYYEAVETAFGGPARLRSKLAAADVVYAFDADFLNPSCNSNDEVRAFMDRRKVGKDLAAAKDSMNRLYLVEGRYTLTSGSADHRLLVPTSHVPAVIFALAKEVAELTGSGELSGLVASVGEEIALPENVDPEWIKVSAKDLVDSKGAALVLVGKDQPVSAQLLGFALNQAVEAYGNTIDLLPPFNQEEADKPLSLVELKDAINSGEVTSLIILNGNPVYNASVDVEWSKAQEKLTTLVHLSCYVDETSATAASGDTWHIPSAHYLEQWGDAYAVDGSYLSLQPMVLPLFGGISQIQLLALLAGLTPELAEGEEAPVDKLPLFEGPELVQETFKVLSAIADEHELTNAWRKLLHDGFLADSAVEPASASFAGGSLIAEELKAPQLSEDSLEVVITPSYTTLDGRYSNNGWMQETADPITKLTWDNAAIMSPKTAKALGYECKRFEGIYYPDIVKLNVNGRELEVRVIETPGHADFSITLSLGYGRTHAGNIGNGYGYNAYSIRTTEAPYVSTGVTSEKIKGFSMGGVLVGDCWNTGDYFAVTQEHWSMEGRAILREVPIAEAAKDKGVIRSLGMESHTPTHKDFHKSTTDERLKGTASLYKEYPEFDYENQHQWGMVIDLNACSGCNACVVSCQAENNIPIVGKEQVAMGREMHWLRIDRYFVAPTEEHHGKTVTASKVEVEKGHGAQYPDNPEVSTMPVTCMHCESAPCETVCPVNATVHSEEGLNVMAYNRCIGTRYCANNCPYKVRRFNFFDYNMRQLDKLYLGDRLMQENGVEDFVKEPLGPYGMEDTLQMQKNPNVSVRMRGVMEKCTFCVQRLETAKIDWKVKNAGTANRRIPADGVKTACQQACPSEAIVFGDLANADSAVAQLQDHPMRYSVLDYLGTKPRVSYLGKVRNPNPEMPDADKVAMALLAEKRAGHHGGHKDAEHHHGDSHGEKENSSH